MLNLRELNRKISRIKSLGDNKLKEMLYARCLAKGANRIAPDILLGMYCTEELYDVFGAADVRRDEDKTIIEVLKD